MLNYNSALQSNNTDLQAILNTINELPEAGSGGGGTDVEDSIISRTISGAYTNDRVMSVGNYAFAACDDLTAVSFPACTTIGNEAFANCWRLTTASFPACTTIQYGAFSHCEQLTTASFPVATTIGNCAFSSCYNLTSLYLTGSSLCTLSNSNAFTSTPIGGYSKSAGTYGSIYVPVSLLASYKAATNWAYFSSRFVGIVGI